MTTNLRENVLTLTTPIAKEMADKAFSALQAKDEEGNVMYVVNVSEEGKGAISSYGLTCNTVVDGKLAVMLTLPMGTTMDKVKTKYGKALLEADKYLPQIVDAVQAEIEAIDRIFA